MSKNTESSLSSVSSDGTTFEWRTDGTKKEVNSGDTNLAQNTIFPLPSTFKVYDKVSEKNRYVPRKWTQEEFEAALPQRFKQGSSRRNEYPIDLAKDVEENDLKYENKKPPWSYEDTLPSPSQAVSQHLPKRPEINEKISHMKAVFQGAQNEDDCDQLSDANELKSCKESETKVILTNEEDPEEETTDGGLLKCEENEFIESCYNTYTSFMDGCLQCLLNLEAVVQPLDACYSAGKTCSSFQIDKLGAILETVQLSDKSNPEKLQQLCLQDVFPKLYKKMQDCNRRLDEVLEFLLKTFIKENGQVRSLFQGKFCHSTFCEQCETVVKEYQPFSFLNPASPPPNNHTLEVNIFSCKDGVWEISSKETSIYPGMTVAGLKEELLNLPDFFDASDVSVIEIGEVMKGHLENIFENTEELLELDLQPGSAIFAFHVLDYPVEVKNSHKDCSQAVKSSARGFADMSYHLYFNCGLCLNDGKEVGLLMHQSCGGMVCRDCLDEILLTNRGWELCPCPICERPIDLDKELCQTKFSMETKETQPDVVCGVMLRTAGYCNGRNSIELFGCPLLVSLPQESSGSELYRFIGCLLPKALPMKDKTSFTLHKVDSSGLRCTTGCSSPDCTGCLIRINDNLILQPGACLAVHFDDLEEGSKRDFGVNIHEAAQISTTQAFFDGILQSCVETCAKETLCPKCFNVCNTTSSIVQFPQLLVIHINEQFANKALPANMTIAEVAQFFILERGNERDEDSKQGPTYHLTAAVLQKDNSPAPTYETCVLGSSCNTWLLYDGVQVSEMHPTQMHLTSGSVLFYEPALADPGSQLSGHVCQLHSTADGQKLDSVDKSDDSNHVAFDICCREPPGAKRLHPIAKRRATKYHPRKTHASTKQLHNNDCFILKSSSSQLEPGEWFPGNGSQLSLGEMKRETNVSSKGIKAAAWKNIDIISPINTTDVCKSESQVFQETKKLVKAVKREDAYDIVCSLNRGADPCVLVNDVTALHLAAGIKTDQRYSVLTYLLRYASNVNVATGDGTTPLHVAAAWGHRDALELLFAHGGDPFELADIEGQSAFDLAANDCSTYLQSVYHRQHSTRFLEISSSSYASLPNRSAMKAECHKGKRLEDIVRSNVGLPSFVEDNNARLRRRWLHRLRNFRERSSGIFRNFRKIGSIRRRSKIGVMVTDTVLEKTKGDVSYLKASSSLI